MVNKQLEFCVDAMSFGSTQKAKAFPCQINAQMLALAREAKGFTQKDFANLIGCPQSRLSKIESGEMVPFENDLHNFVRILGQSWDFFFQQGATLPASVSFYRKIQSLPSKMLRQCNAQMNVRRLQVERQIGSIRLGKREMPHWPPEKNGGVKAVAKRVRQEWGINTGPVWNLMELAEDAGCVVIDYAFPSAKLDGLCIRSEQKTPIIFLNKGLPKSRRRLSLAHEIGHLVMHTDPHENVEVEAMDFAGEFLMPAMEIDRQFDRLNLDKLGQLKKEWGVSMQAILFRARKLEKISESYYRFLMMQIGKHGYRVNEPFEDAIPSEKPMELDIRLKT